jgi:hypothetical protein
MIAIIRKKCFFIPCAEFPDGTLIPLSHDSISDFNPGEEVNGTILDVPEPITTTPTDITKKLTLITDKSFKVAPKVIIEEKDLPVFQT